jgi:hypothetical protein
MMGNRVSRFLALPVGEFGVFVQVVKNQSVGLVASISLDRHRELAKLKMNRPFNILL